MKVDRRPAVGSEYRVNRSRFECHRGEAHLGQCEWPEWLKGMVDLHGKELTVLFERFSHLSSPRIERSDGNTLRVAEISDGKIGLMVKLDQS